MVIGSESGGIWVAFGMLFGFGALYNLLVAWLERQGYDEGVTALLVVSGVLATFVGIGAIRWQLLREGVVITRDAALGTWASSLLLDLGAFAASGFWMVVGSWWRYAQRRQMGQICHRQIDSVDGGVYDEGTALADECEDCAGQGRG